jgi:hypothetical protein
MRMLHIVDIKLRLLASRIVYENVTYCSGCWLLELFMRMLHIVDIKVRLLASRIVYENVTYCSGC